MSFFDVDNVPNEPFTLYDQIDVHLTSHVNGAMLYIHVDSNYQFFDYNLGYYTQTVRGADVINVYGHTPLRKSGIIPFSHDRTVFIALFPVITNEYFLQRIAKSADINCQITNWKNSNIEYFPGRHFSLVAKYDFKYIWTEPIRTGQVLSIPCFVIDFNNWKGLDWTIPIHIKYDVGVLINDSHRPVKVYYQEPNDLYQPDWSFLQPCLKEPGKRPFLPEKYPYNLDHDNPSLPTEHTSRKQRRAYAKWRALHGTQQSSNSNTLQEFLKTWNSRRFSAQTISTQ